MMFLLHGQEKVALFLEKSVSALDLFSVVHRSGGPLLHVARDDSELFELIWLSSV